MRNVDNIGCSLWDRLLCYRGEFFADGHDRVKDWFEASGKGEVVFVVRMYPADSADEIGMGLGERGDDAIAVAVNIWRDNHRAIGACVHLFDGLEIDLGGVF